MKNKTYKHASLILFTIMILGLIVRVYKLDYLSFWSVEAKIVSFAEHRFQEMFDFSLAYRPLYLLLSRVWINIFGTGEFAVRFLSVVLGTLSIFLIFKIGKLLYGERTGLLAAFILSLSVQSIAFSREARGDFILIVVLAMSAFLLMIKLFSKDKIKYYVFITALNMLILLAHPYGVFWVLTQNICFFTYKTEKNTKRWLAAMSIVLVFFVPWYFFVNSYNPTKGIFWFEAPNPKTILETFDAFNCGGAKVVREGLGLTTGLEKMVFARMLSVIYTVIFLMQLFFAKSKEYCKKPGAEPVLLCWLMTPIISAYVYSLIFQPVYQIRYLIFAAPAYYLLIARFLSRLRPRLTTGILTFIFLLSFLSLNNIYNPASTNGYRDAAKFLKAGIKKNDAIIISPAEMLTIFMYYCAYDDHKVLGRIDDEFGMKIDGKWKEDFYYNGVRMLCLTQETTRQFSARFDYDKFNFNNHDNIWLVSAPHWPGNKRSKFLEEFLQRKFTLKKQRTFECEGLDVNSYSFKKKL
ncbi:MAG: glycosyltransferase family 39 protein [Candidatus Omnitrophica bacterium]|nr:glycosyltransferase family 39 protein [Candidatus Omnitrophota bacterium]MBU1925553.1 glycosyltransferase family 39 protein [Candidatus Omnitrophota bacterium]